MRIRKLSAAIAIGAAALALSACAKSLNTTVSRYQAMPAPQGQTFYVVPAGGLANNGGLEFQRYAGIVAQQLQARGYTPATNAQSANMIVQFGYGIDRGQVRYVSDPFYGVSAMGALVGDFGARAASIVRASARLRRRLFWGWDDPFWYGGGIDSYVEYHSQIDLHIRQTGTNAPLFDGRAQARSETNRLDVVIPGLVDAMFTGFPGRSGETVRITIPPRQQPRLKSPEYERPVGAIRRAFLFGAERSAFELARQQADVRIELGVAGAELLDLADGVDHGRVIAPAEAAADVRKRFGRELLREVHRDLARAGDFAGPARRRHLGLADPVMLGDLGLDLVDRDPALVGAKDVGEHFFDEGDVDRRARSSSHRRQCG